MKCTNFLAQDHKTILRSLDILAEMAARVRNGGRIENGDVETILKFLRVFGDDCHQTMEESALFPVLMRSSAAQRRPVRQLLFEHEQERSLVEGLEDALKTKQGMDFVHYADRLCELLKNHIYKEENILFGVVEMALTKEDDDWVTAEFAKFRSDPAFVADLNRLEWKYLRKKTA